MSSSNRVVRLAAWGLLVVAVVLLAMGAFRPIEGTDIDGSGVSVACGPAVTAWLDQTGPRAGPDILAPGSDDGVTASAWCVGEAGEWVRPLGAAGLALLMLALAAFAIGRIASRKDGYG